MARFVVVVLVAISVSVIGATSAVAARSNNCTSKAGMKWLKTLEAGAVRKTLHRGRYCVREHKKPGVVTICDSRAPVRTAFRKTEYSFAMDKASPYRVSKILAVAGKCVALRRVAPAGSGAGPAASIADMRPKAPGRQIFTFYVGYPLIDAKVVGFQLSKTCVLGATWGNGSTRGVYLRSSVTQAMWSVKLSPNASDSDLLSLRLDGDSYSYTDGGKGVSGKL